MALPDDLDLALAIEELNKNENTYELSSSVPPHTLTVWDSDNIDAEPTETELINAWNSWKSKHHSVAMDVLRRERNDRLNDSDWCNGNDVTMTTAWKNYRQALRDLPANTSDPKNPTWPTKPT